MIIHPHRSEELQKQGGIFLKERGKLIQIKGVSHASADLSQAQVAERQARSAKLLLNSQQCKIDIRTEYQNTLSPGSGITLWAMIETGSEFPNIIGSDALGERGKKAEEVGKEAAENLLKEIKSLTPADVHLADQLIPFIALFGGEIKPVVETPHVLANRYVCEKFLGHDIHFASETAERFKLKGIWNSSNIQQKT